MVGDKQRAWFVIVMRSGVVGAGRSLSCQSFGPLSLPTPNPKTSLPPSYSTTHLEPFFPNDLHHNQLCSDRRQDHFQTSNSYFYLAARSIPTMSRASKLTLGGASLFAISTVVFVHYTQSAEKAVLSPLSPLPMNPLLSLRR